MLASAVDALLEATVAGSFSRAGYLVRKAVERWERPPRADGTVMVVTGASSGIGKAAAVLLGQLGAQVWAVGRDPERTQDVADAVRRTGGDAEVALVDVADASSVDAFAERFFSVHEHLDGLVHCAGALLRDYTVSSDGTEMTVATNVLGPYRLTWRLAPLLHRSSSPTIVTVSSGGMYAERFDLDRLEMRLGHYNGARAYARAKRAQVVLAREWSRRWASSGVASYAMHPGWVDTPGLASGLPLFRLGPLLRRPEEGADTAVWLVTGAARSLARRAAATSLSFENGFWHDRHLRGEHYLPWTRPREGHEEQGRQLWDWCAARTGLGADA
ncbi:MAG: SDR family NAD(P)-dependent oxidoreductase [Acidimicrobiales bacterium]